MDFLKPWYVMAEHAEEILDMYTKNQFSLWISWITFYGRESCHSQSRTSIQDDVIKQVEDWDPLLSPYTLSTYSIQFCPSFRLLYLWLQFSNFHPPLGLLGLTGPPDPLINPGLTRCPRPDALSRFNGAAIFSWELLNLQLLVHQAGGADKRPSWYRLGDSQMWTAGYITSEEVERWTWSLEWRSTSNGK